MGAFPCYTEVHYLRGRGAEKKGKSLESGEGINNPQGPTIYIVQGTLFNTL